LLAYFFSEMPYPYVPETVVEELNSARVIVPNAYCDPNAVAELYDRYLEEFEYAEHLGLELALSEHHQTMTCLNVSSPLTAAVLARRTKRARIAFVGIPLPIRDNPVRVAEELAMLDCLSRGRIITSFIRGVATEVHPANTNPVLTRERMEEAHELIVKTWTTPEPFSWEGRFCHYRYVNAWPRPYQQPHPPIWWTGSDTDNAVWAADRQYPFAVFLLPLDRTEVLFDAYRARWRERGLGEASSEQFAYMGMVYTAETDEQAREDSREFLWYLTRRRHPNLVNVPGYAPAGVLARSLGAARGVAGGDDRYSPGASPARGGLEALEASGGLIAGSPSTVLKKITHMYERCGVGHLLMMSRSGLLPTRKVRRSLELFATEIYPAVRELGAARTDGAASTAPAAQDQTLGVLA
jgi:alkanesulfonate monooxygenase SsuD/methylene tetrahydromethanopterin reductase-like flavin-dependent oxidoreductase (luciferase family)